MPLRSDLSLTIPYIAVIAAAWAFFGVIYAVPYWQQGGDYPWYALSHAFTLETIVSGVPAANLGYSGHPGLPFGFLSWVAFRLASFGIDGADARIAFVIDHAEAFWLFAKVFALALTLLGVFVLQRLLGLAWAIGVAAYFSITGTAIGVSLVQLTNESFALPVVAATYGIGYWLLTAESEKDRNVAALWIGALAVFGWSIKVYYLAPAIGIFAGSLLAGVMGVISWRALLRSYGLALASFVLLGIVIVMPTMGLSGLTNWATWNWNMLVHVDRYGSGAEGVASISTMAVAARDIIEGTGWRLPLVAAVIFTMLSASIMAGVRSLEWRHRYLPFCLAVSLGFTLSLFGLLKHYTALNEYYLLPICATLPCFLIVARDQIGSRLLGVGTTVAVVLVGFNVATFVPRHFAALTDASALLADVADIQRLPLEQGERRVWAYYSATKEGALPLVLQYAGSPIATKVFGDRNSPDTAPQMDPAARDWKYVIFPKSYYPTAKSIRESYRKYFDFVATQFQITERDQIQELRRAFVLTRP